MWLNLTLLKSVLTIDVQDQQYIDPLAISNECAHLTLSIGKSHMDASESNLLI